MTSRPIDPARAAATGDWAGAADWALLRALRAVEDEEQRGPSEEQRRLLEEARAEESDRVRAIKTAAALGRGGRAAKHVRDAVTLRCVSCAGTHSDPDAFDAALDDAFGRRVCADIKLYSQLQASYQQLFKHVVGKFASKAEANGRKKRPPRERGAPAANPEPAQDAERDVWDIRSNDSFETSNGTTSAGTPCSPVNVPGTATETTWPSAVWYPIGSGTPWQIAYGTGWAFTNGHDQPDSAAAGIGAVMTQMSALQSQVVAMQAHMSLMQTKLDELKSLEKKSLADDHASSW